MNRLIAGGTLALFAAVALFLLARERIWSYSELEGACKDKTQAYFMASGGVPTDWTPLMKSGAGDNQMSFYGDWRSGQRHFVIQCTTSFGKPIDSIGFEVAEQP